MFVERLQKDNPKFLTAMIKLQQEGAILPDSYAVDMEQFRANTAAIVASAKEKGIKLYFMLKQIGRNPVLAKELVKQGYDGAVVVDFKEAQVMMRHNIPIGNVGGRTTTQWCRAFAARRPRSSASSKRSTTSIKATGSFSPARRRWACSTEPFPSPP